MGGEISNMFWLGFSINFHLPSNLMEIAVPKEWYDVIDILEKERGIVILLGATDTGKTTLAKFLINHFIKKRVEVALVDADIGQSSIGPPTTIGLVLFELSPNWEELKAQDIFFMGATTPEENLPLHLNGVRKMVDKAITYGGKIVLVDTTGLVSGEVGKELKRSKIDLLSPCSLLVLQRSGEIEPILSVVERNPNVKVYRLPISKQARSRSKEERRAYRTRKYQEYFKDSEIKDLMMEGIMLEGKVLDSNGQPILFERALRMNGLLLGFKTINGETLALGMIKDFFEAKGVLKVSTPLEDFKKVKSIQLSSVRLSPSYEEEKMGSLALG